VNSSYRVVMLLTLLAALGCLAWQQRRGRKDALDLGLLALLAGVIGARVGHVLANWAYYGERQAAMFDLRDGGLSWHGGLLAGLAALALAAAGMPPPTRCGCKRCWPCWPRRWPLACWAAGWPVC
jgi:prolipoprotein diacylglyceryltransferase